MANGININHNEIGNTVIYNIQNHSVILEQLDKSYADQTFVENPIGLKNQSVEIVKTLSMSPATSFVGSIVPVPYNESSVKLVIDELFDKSHTFTVNEQNLNPGAISRAGAEAGNSCKDAMEIKALNAMALAAVPIALPADGLASTEAYSILEKFMIDSKIKSSESVVFINSATRQKMTKATTLFTYARNKDAKFSDGLGGNEEYAAGTGYVTTEFGMNFYLSEKLSANYAYFGGVVSGATYVSGSANASINAINKSLGLQFDGQTPSFYIGMNTILNVDGKLFKTTTDYFHTQRSEAGDIVEMLNTVSLSENYVTTLVGKPVNLVANQAGKFRNFLLSKKSIAFACKAPAVVADNQVVVGDSTSGIATRVSSFYNGTTKELTISVDCWCGVAAFYDDIAVFE